MIALGPDGTHKFAAPVAAERLALVGGRLINGFGHGPLADSVVLIEDDEIIKVGQVGSLAVPDCFEN
ncbi:MAG: hypothetical protein ACNA7E_09935 [Wenzhouxiangellaceae bacterium]